MTKIAPQMRALKEKLRKEHELYLHTHRDNLRVCHALSASNTLLREIRLLMEHCHSYHCKTTSFPEGNLNCIGCIVSRKIKKRLSESGND